MGPQIWLVLWAVAASCRCNSIIQKDAYEAAEQETVRVDDAIKAKKLAEQEQREKARVRYINARNKELLKQVCSHNSSSLFSLIPLWLAASPSIIPSTDMFL